jgi:hypothetical protein
MKRMMAISLHQPWASLVAAGVKPYETRTWAPDGGLVGADIAIHAARYVDHINTRFAEEAMAQDSLREKLASTWGTAVPRDLMGRFGSAVMPVGCIVCTVRLAAALELGEGVAGSTLPRSHILRRIESRPMPGCFTVRHDEWGKYAPGRWAWLLTDPVPIRPPVAMKGKQRFFNLPANWLSSDKREHGAG